MVLQIILRTNYEGKGQVKGQTIFPDHYHLYPPALRTPERNKYLVVQVGIMDDDSPHSDKIFTGCCHPYRRIVALDESHFRNQPGRTSTTTSSFDLFYIGSRCRGLDNHHADGDDITTDSSIHRLALIPTETNCRDWSEWIFLGECQTCVLRLQMARYLKQFFLIQQQQQQHHQPPETTAITNHHRRHNPGTRPTKKLHLHMEAFLDGVAIPKHPPHWLANHPNIDQCSKRHHVKLSIRTVFQQIRNEASLQYNQQQQQQQPEKLSFFSPKITRKGNDAS